MIRLARPTFEADEIDAVIGVLKSGNLIQGAHVAAFEAAVARTLGVAHAVACTSGTAALHLAMLALGLNEGDEVIVPTYTFPATANVVEMAGGTARIVDIDPTTFNIDVEGVKRAIGPRTRAIMPVHLFGLCADMAQLTPLAKEHGLPLIEDAACALGTYHPGPDGELLIGGTSGLMACWSFHPRKVVTTAEGGMVTTDDDGVATRLRALRNHGAVPTDTGLTYPAPGLNYRLSELHGALGVGQMTRLEGFVNRRRALAAIYDAALAHVDGVTLPHAPEGQRHVYQSYITRISGDIDRDALITRLRGRGVEASIGTYALHLMPYYRERYGLKEAAFPGGNEAFHHAVALPLHPGMSDEDARTVAGALAEELAR